MKAAIYNPYWDTLGGGERYVATVAEVLARNGWDVDIEWVGEDLKEKLQLRFALDLSGVNIVADCKRGDGYDLMFWVSDGSIPTLKARKNFLHLQVPFKNVNGTSLLNKMKFFRINKIIANSEFTKNVIDEEYGITSVVIRPPVATNKFKALKKENQIIYVGRFSNLTQFKRQDVLISSFKKLYDSGYVDWKLILAGGVEVGAGNDFEELKKSIKSYPIEVVESPDFKNLKLLVGNSKIFWSAAGYGVDENKNPQKVEHFGITVVEAMSAGVVPVVINMGGYKEIIENGESGILWENPLEMRQKTRELIKNNKLLREMAKKAQIRAEEFSEERFEKEFLALI